MIVEFPDTEPGEGKGDFEALPEGDYLLSIYECKLGQSQDKSKSCLEVTFKVLS